MPAPKKRERRDGDYDSVLRSADEVVEDAREKVAHLVDLASHGVPRAWPTPPELAENLLESLEGLRGSLHEVADQAKADREALVAQLKADSIAARRRARRRFRLGLVASVPVWLIGTYIASRLGLHLSFHR
jgi:hypothetical protein